MSKTSEKNRKTTVSRKKGTNRKVVEKQSGKTTGTVNSKVGITSNVRTKSDQKINKKKIKPEGSKAKNRPVKQKNTKSVSTKDTRTRKRSTVKKIANTVKTPNPKKLTKRTHKPNSKEASVQKNTVGNSIKKERYPIIDLLKAFAALLVVLIHVTSRYKGNGALMAAFYDYIHFSVGLFVLASGFLAANSYRKISSKTEVWKYLVKKFKRIVIPYYEFAFLFVLVSVLFLDKDISKYLGFESIKDTLLLSGGVGNNWIPKLFFSFSIILLIDGFLAERVKMFRVLLVSIVFSGATYLMTRTLSIPYIHSNLFGWTLILYVGFFMYKYNSQKTLLSTIALSGSLWFLLRAIYGYMGLDSGIFTNKYPPDLYFVSYNVFASAIVWSVGMNLLPLLERSRYLVKLINYISAKSYEIFFYHLLIMEVWKWKVNWYVDWFLIVLMSLCLVWLLDHIKALVIKPFQKKEKPTRS